MYVKRLRKMAATIIRKYNTHPFVEFCFQHDPTQSIGITWHNPRRRLEVRIMPKTRQILLCMFSVHPKKQKAVFVGRHTTHTIPEK